MDSDRIPVSARVREFAFFAVFLLYAWAGIDSRLMHLWQGLAFSTMPGFAAGFFTYPGGPADYLNRLIAQAYAFRWPGAVVMTAQAVAVSALTQVYVRSLAGRALPLIRFVPAILLLFYLSSYHERDPVVVSLMVGISLAILFARLARNRRSQTTLSAAFVAMLLAAYGLAGVAIVFFAPAAAAVQIAHRPRRPVGLAYLLLAVALPLGARRIWLAEPPALVVDWFVHPDRWQMVVRWSLYLLYGLIPIAALVPRFLAGNAVPRTPRPVPPGKRFPIELAATTSLLVVLCAVAAASYRMNGASRRILYMDYCSLNEQWAQVIERSRDLRANEFDDYTRCDVNLALHMTNRLGDDMFAFPQRGPMVPDARDFQRCMIKRADLFLRLGRVNDAERIVYEELPYTPSDVTVLRLLARIHMVKGALAAARKPLTVLTHDLVRGAWARRYLRQLEQDPALARDEGIQALRRRMLQKDDMAAVTQGNRTEPDMERLLLDQLDQDPGNRMAFEFLMGAYMLDLDLARISRLMPRIKDMTGPGYIRPDGSRRTPRLYQEAMAVHFGVTGRPVDIEGFAIEPQTMQRMFEFQRVSVLASNPQAAIRALGKEYGDGFFFHFYSNYFGAAASR